MGSSHSNPSTHTHLLRALCPSPAYLLYPAEDPQQISRTPRALPHSSLAQQLLYEYWVCGHVPPDPVGNLRVTSQLASYWPTCPGPKSEPVSCVCRVH